MYGCHLLHLCAVHISISLLLFALSFAPPVTLMYSTYLYMPFVVRAFFRYICDTYVQHISRYVFCGSRFLSLPCYTYALYMSLYALCSLRFLHSLCCTYVLNMSPESNLLGNLSSVLYHSYSGMFPCLIFQQTRVPYRGDAIVPPGEDTLPLK